jgi:hypothetical protein
MAEREDVPIALVLQEREIWCNHVANWTTEVLTSESLSQHVRAMMNFYTTKLLSKPPTPARKAYRKLVAMLLKGYRLIQTRPSSNIQVLNGGLLADKKYRNMSSEALAENAILQLLTKFREPYGGLTWSTRLVKPSSVTSAPIIEGDVNRGTSVKKKINKKIEKMIAEQRRKAGTKKVQHSDFMWPTRLFNKISINTDPIIEANVIRLNDVMEELAYYQQKADVEIENRIDTFFVDKKSTCKEKVGKLDDYVDIEPPWDETIGKLDDEMLPPGNLETRSWIWLGINMLGFCKPTPNDVFKLLPPKHQERIAKSLCEGEMPSAAYVQVIKCALQLASEQIKEEKPKQASPNGLLSKPMSKSQMMHALGMDGYKRFNAFAKGHEIREAGNRQLFQIRLDGMDINTRTKLEKA